MRFIQSILLMLAIFGASGAHAEGRASVKIVGTTRDTVGLQLVSAVREEVNRSSLLTLVYGDESAIEADIMTMNPDGGAFQTETVYSFVINIKVRHEDFPLFVDQLVGTCGRTMVDSCAKSIKATIESTADRLRTIIASAKE